MKQLRKSLSLLCALTMVLTFLSIPALAEETAFAGGSGASAGRNRSPGRGSRPD